MLEKPRGCEDLSLEKQKTQALLSQKSEISETQSVQRWTIIQGKYPAGARTFATELSVPNMHIRTQGF